MILNGIKLSQIWPNWTKKGQTGLNICQTDLNKPNKIKRLKWGLKVVNKGKIGLNRVKLS